MDQIMAMVKTVGGSDIVGGIGRRGEGGSIDSLPSSSLATVRSSSSVSGIDGSELNDVKPSIVERETLLNQCLPHLSTSTDSINDEAILGEWADSESNDSKCQSQGNFRVLFDNREKKLQEKIEFVKIVYKYKSSLFGDCDGHEITPRSKEDSWKRVAAEVETIGLESYKGKPWARLRDHDWQYVRRHALSRNENSNRPTGKLGELDRLVLDIISTTSLVNSVNQSSNSLMSQSSTNSAVSQQSTESAEYWRNLMGAVSQESTETPELLLTLDGKDELTKLEGIINSNSLAVNAPEHILDLLNKVVPKSCLSVDAALQSASRALSKSPISKKITSRSATAPSVYAITSSTASPPQSSNSSAIQFPPAKRLRMDSEKSPSAPVTPMTFEQKKEMLVLKKLEVDIRHTELLNEKLEREIRAIEAQEKRSIELHAIEIRAAKSRMYRGAAIDETSIDVSEHSSRVLVRQPNGLNLE